MAHKRVLFRYAAREKILRGAALLANAASAVELKRGLDWTERRRLL
jgi:hypothetical protein